MWRPDNFMKQNHQVALIGPIKPMDSHFAGSCTSLWSVAIPDFGKLLLDPKSYVMLSTKLWDRYVCTLSGLTHREAQYPGERQMACKKRVLSPGNTSGSTHYPIFLTPQFSYHPFPLKYFYYPNQADKCLL